MRKKKNNLGDRIYNWRQRNNASQDDFAELVGVSRQAVMKWEVGDVVPKADKLPKISEIIGVGLDQLMADEDSQALAEVVADEVAQESQVVKESAVAKKKKGKKFKLSKKAKIAIATTVIVLVLVIGIFLLVFDKIWTTPEFEGAAVSAKSDTWNFSIENLGWILFGVSIAVGVTLGAVFIYKLVKSKKKIKEDTSGDEPKI